MKPVLWLAFALVLFALSLPGNVLAYGGPGSVISGIGAFLAALAALVASLFGFIWFPVKRLYRRMTKEDAPQAEASQSQTSE